MYLRESIDIYERYGDRQDEAYMLYRYATLQDLDDKQSMNFLEQALRIILRNAEKN